MVFLNPSILFGLLAASIPVLIHIINLRKLKKVEFSTLVFLKELQKSKIKKIKIKQWLLLLLRTLIIIFLVLAFARPTMESVTLIGSTATAKSSAVFIIDNSFSMNYVGDEGSLFNKGKMIAKDIISSMNENDDFIILNSIDSLKTVSSKLSALKHLNNYKFSFVSEPTVEKIVKAIDILKESQNINKEIYLFSDFQKSTFKPKNYRELLKEYIGEYGIKFYAFDLSLEEASNISVSDLTLENAIVEMNKKLTFTATVSNFSPVPADNVITSLFINDKRVAQGTINLAPGDIRNVKFETQLNTKGLNEVRVELEEDNLIEDNTAYLSFLVPDKIKLLLLYDNKSDLFFLETALNSLTDSDQIEFISNNVNEILSNSLSDFNLLILIGTKTQRVSELKEYLSNGGKLVYIPPSDVNENNLSNLQELISLPSIIKIVDSDFNNKNYSEFGNTDTEHPIFVSLFEENKKPEIESPNIFKYIKFKESNEVNAIIRLIDDSIFLGEYRANNGKVLFFNTSHILSWSNFPVKGIYAPLISRIIYYLSTKDELKKNYFPGEKIPIDISNSNFPIVEVTLPSGTDRISVSANDRDKIIYGNTDELGIYKFRSEDNLIYHGSVNSNPSESDLTKIEDETASEIYDNLFGRNYLILKPDDNYFENINLARFGTELWSYFLAIALLLAIIEMFIARSSKRDLLHTETLK